MPKHQVPEGVVKVIELDAERVEGDWESALAAETPQEKAWYREALAEINEDEDEILAESMVPRH